MLAEALSSAPPAVEDDDEPAELVVEVEVRRPSGVTDVTPNPVENAGDVSFRRRERRQ